jgi:hypothetical protein
VVPTPSILFKTCLEHQQVSGSACWCTHLLAEEEEDEGIARTVIVASYRPMGEVSATSVSRYRPFQANVSAEESEVGTQKFLLSSRQSFSSEEETESEVRQCTFVG